VSIVIVPGGCVAQAAMKSTPASAVLLAMETRDTGGA
jgi:hypothetical protein